MKAIVLSVLSLSMVLGMRPFVRPEKSITWTEEEKQQNEKLDADIKRLESELDIKKPTVKAANKRLKIEHVNNNSSIDDKIKNLEKEIKKWDVKLATKERDAELARKERDAKLARKKLLSEKKKLPSYDRTWSIMRGEKQKK